VDPFFFFLLFQQVIENFFLHTHDNVRIHLHEAAIGVIGS
jgi:hypothetical protein